MITKLARKFAYLPELFRKYKVLRDNVLLDDRVSAKELKQYLFACNTIGQRRGYLRALRDGMCVDSAGEPIPWYTYPAIEQLAKWDFANCEVFEYGCGNSTRWWARRAKRVVTVESSPEWYGRILASRVLPSNVTPILARTDGEERSVLDSYVATLDAFGEFDVIIIDGETRNRTRFACASAALLHLRKGGMIVLDNSDWHPDASQMLREAGLLELDYTGIAPLVTHAETTSLFLSPEFRVKPAYAVHPGFAIAGLENVWG